MPLRIDITDSLKGDKAFSHATIKCCHFALEILVSNLRGDISLYIQNEYCIYTPHKILVFKNEPQHFRILYPLLVVLRKKLRHLITITNTVLYESFAYFSVYHGIDSVFEISR